MGNVCRHGVWVGVLLGAAGCGQTEDPKAIVEPIVFAKSQLAPIGGGNALTLPAQRHLVRLAPSGTPWWLLAVQQDGADGHGLGLFRSDDDGKTFRYYQPIQNDATERDTADLVVVGNDIAMVYSWEGPTLTGSTRHDVYFQWWRYASGNWTPQPPVRVFDSTSASTAYYRAELARDSQGRLWVQAFLLQANGSSLARIAVSSDGGNSFSVQPNLATTSAEGGGRLLSLGDHLVFVWDVMDGTSTAQVRTRADGDPLGTWSATRTAFTGGIYHGAACSAVADGQGGMHLAYKDKNMVLWYRRFDGTNFGAAQQIESQGDWELQPAITRMGNDLWIFYNRVRTSGFDDEVRARRLVGGVLTAPEVMDGTVSFKGYPAAVDVLPAGAQTEPVFFGVTPTANDGGQLVLYAVATGAPPAPSPDLAMGAPDLAVPAPDLGTPDLAVPPDLSTGGGTPTLLFSDAFNRNSSSGLGSSWSIGSGAWYTDGRAVTDRDGGDLAGENPVTCRDCRVAAQVLGFGVAQTGVYLRAPSATSTDRYDLVLLSNAHIQIRRVRSGAATVLGDVAANVALDDLALLSLAATGASPVTLVAQVNGTTRLTVTDASSAALTAAGRAGMWTTNAGVVFDNFELWSIGGGAPPPDMAAPPADLSVPPDLSVPRDLSVPPDLSVPRDLSVPPDLSRPPDLATPPVSGTLFTDAFNRNNSSSLGASWSIASGFWYTDGRAVTDLDGGDRAGENQAACRDCTVQVTVLGFGVPETGAFLRAPTPTSADRYDLVLLGNGHLQIRRFRSGASTVLGDVASGLGTLDEPAVLTLSATGASPVTLQARVAGAIKLTVTDASASALTGAGYAGLWTTNAGVVFDDFTLSGTTSSGGGTPDLGVSVDAGSSSPFALDVTFTDTTHDLFAVDSAGTAYATLISDGSQSQIYASSDGRTWSLRGQKSGCFLDVMSAVGSGVLLADCDTASGHVIARSSDHGVTWTNVLPLGQYRMLTPHSVAELDGTVYLLDYQSFSQTSQPIALHASTDGGATWSTRFTFQGHRHGHGLAADPSTHVLWAYFGDTDAQSGIYRSSNAGASWTLVLGNQDGDVVDATPLPGGGLLFGQDISFLPTRPSVARLDGAGTYTVLAPLTGPSYAIHALAQGGFVVSAERENGGDIYPPGEVSAHVYGSADGVHFTDLLKYPWADPTAEIVRADVYWELPSHELVLTLENAAGFGAGGRGYQLLRRR